MVVVIKYSFVFHIDVLVVNHKREWGGNEERSTVSHKKQKLSSQLHLDLVRWSRFHFWVSVVCIVCTGTRLPVCSSLEVCLLVACVLQYDRKSQQDKLSILFLCHSLSCSFFLTYITSPNADVHMLLTSVEYFQHFNPLQLEGCLVETY